jgi:hypothetical protein
MRRVWLPMLVLPVLLLGAALQSMLAARRYAHAVYYVHIAEIHPGAPSGQNEYDEWYDPAGRAFRADYVYAGAFFRQALQDGVLYWTDAGGRSAHEATVGPNAYRTMVTHWSGAVSAALLGTGGYYVRHAAGSISRVQLAGRAALMLQISDPDVPDGGTTVWLDPRTHAPVQEMWFSTPIAPVLWRFSAPRLIRPGTLPADFFAPQHPSAWDQVGGWLAAHMPHRRG